MKTTIQLARAAWLVLAIVFVASIAGCGSSGPTRYNLSGTITHKGQPVKKGNITLSPDSSKGNEGPGGMAEIKDGKYTTLPGKGVVGGAYILTVNGFDGVPIESGEGGMDEMGKQIITNHVVNVDLPKENFEHNIDVPK